MNGFLLIDKPKGVTSANCVYQLRKILGDHESFTPLPPIWLHLSPSKDNTAALPPGRPPQPIISLFWNTVMALKLYNLENFRFHFIMLSYCHNQ